jgi:toxin ParE1/3/4
VKLVVSQTARADLERLRAFLSDKNPHAAGRAVAALTTAMLSLDAFRERGRPSGVPGRRELVVPFGRSAYVMRYQYLPDANQVIILRIWHGREARR